MVTGAPLSALPGRPCLLSVTIRAQTQSVTPYAAHCRNALRNGPFGDPAVRRSAHGSHRQQHCGHNAPQRRPRVTASAVAAPAVGGGPAAVLLSLGVFLLGLALAVLAVAAVPFLWEMRRTAKEMQRLTRALEREIPDTAATMRLTGMELSDAISEVSALSGDVTRGLQSSVRMLTEAESTMKQGAAFVRETATKKVVPALASQVPQAKEVLEGLLKANSALKHTQPTLLQLTTATKVTARRLRLAIAAADMYSRASAVSNFLRQRAAGGSPYTEPLA